jgi:hypothetical protein
VVLLILYPQLFKLITNLELTFNPIDLFITVVIPVKLTTKFKKMQTILLKEGFESVFSTDFLEKVKQENEFIYLNMNRLNISFDLDVSNLYKSIWGEGEPEYQAEIDELEEKFPLLKNYFIDDFFEIVYYKFDDNFVTMYQFKDNKVLSCSNSIYNLCQSYLEPFEDEDERFEELDNIVLLNIDDIKNGTPTDELLNALRQDLCEV